MMAESANHLLLLVGMFFEIAWPEIFLVFDYRRSLQSTFPSLLQGFPDSLFVLAIIRLINPLDAALIFIAM